MTDVALNEAALTKIDAALGGPDAGSGWLAGFRQDFPELSLTRCDVSDLGVEPPFRVYERFNLYLVDASDHCWRLTADPARATGVVVAAKP
ncbi:MAG: hypothetical protein ABSB70_13060 [Candidatus Velthaea sp.]|jgi:hypothetical protein